MDHLTRDPAFTAATFIVIDFETTTPAGYRPEPIEVAAVWLTVQDGTLGPDGRSFQALICPPAHAQITPLDAHQTGITAAMTAHQPRASHVLAQLDAEAATGQVVLVAHNAPTEAGVLYDYRSACPHLAATGFLDTVKLARAAYPQFASHSLDSLLTHLPVPAPRGRHRAMPDTEAAASIFARVLTDGPAVGSWRTLADLRRAAGYKARAAIPVQDALSPPGSREQSQPCPAPVRAWPPGVGRGNQRRR